MEEQLAKYFAGEATDKEKDDVLAWRSESEENAVSFLEYKETWLLTEKEGILAPVQATRQNAEVKVIGWPGYLKYAAAVVLLAMIGAIWYFNQENEVTLTPTVFAGSSQILEDGSTLSLKNGAEITKLSFTESERKVYVKGKVFFEVVRDENRPFFVITEDATVRVLGTSFLVNSEADYTEVCVESGSVSFSTKTNLSLNLEKGDLGMIGKDIKGVIKRRNDDRNLLAWKDGLMSFERTPTSKVIATLEDTYDVKIMAPEKIMNCRLTAQFSQNSLEEVIQILSATFNWTFEIDKDKVVLSGEGC